MFFNELDGALYMRDAILGQLLKFLNLTYFNLYLTWH